MTWNLQGSQRPDIEAVAAVIREFQPDIIAIQEVQKHQARQLARKLGWSHVWVFKHNGYGPLLPRRAEGMAIMSPHRLQDTGHTCLNPEFNRFTYRRRIAMWATYIHHDQELTIFNVHLSSDDSSQAGLDQARLVRNLIDRRASHQVCVAGDFNDHNEPAVVHTLCSGHLLDAWTHADTRSANGLTNPSAHPHQRLDHILVPNTYRIDSVNVPQPTRALAQLSDHLPVVLRFRCN